MAETLGPLDVLKSIDATLKTIAAAIVAQAPKPAATDRDLDGKWGNPELRFMPKDWTGESYKGCLFSQCPPELLDLVAESLDYFAKKSEEANELTSSGKPVAPFKRADAARARGWAKRLRAGWSGPTEPTQPADPWDKQPSFPSDDDIRF